jgi:ADP-ribose pyrophosphatase YjhB (NUDIX family)
MKFCSQCGSAVEFRVPEGDNLPRFICVSCAHIHYQNPRIVIGCIPQWQDEILLCKRAIEPRAGYWTLPAGFLENGETLAEGAKRETLEEAAAIVDLLDLYAIINVPHIHQLHMFYLARLPEPSFGAGIESLETALHREDQIPWEDLAFPTVYKVLRKYFEERRSGRFGLHIMDIRWQAGRPRPASVREYAEQS